MKGKGRFPEQTLLVAFRDRAGWTQQDVADRAKLSKCSISNVESGYSRPGSIVKKRLFELFSMKFPDEVKTMDDIFLPAMFPKKNTMARLVNIET